MLITTQALVASFATLVACRALHADIRATGPSTSSVKQVANPGYKGYVATGQSALYRAYNKFGRKPPAAVKAAAVQVAAKLKGSTVAEPEAYDVAYLATVSIGTPAVNLFLDFDTGSSDLWVFSTETDPADVDRQKLYNPANSKTSKQLKGATWNISYGDGTGANGDVWLDVVNIGGVKVKHQAVESALELSQSFSEDSAKSGLLGLGFSSLNTVKPNKQQTWFDNIKGSLSKGLFTADLNAGQFGTYDFGYIDKTKYNGDIFYTKVNNTQGFWGVTPTGYKVGSAINVPLSFQAIVDTGTSLLLLPDETVEDYYSQVAHSTYSTVEGGWIFPCLTAAPDFLLNIGSYQATIPGAYINYAPSQTRDNYCYGGIQSAVGLPFSILGDVFIKSQFVVFDSENGRVGFAGKNTTTASSE